MMTSRKIIILSSVILMCSIFVMHISNKTYNELFDVDVCPCCFGTSVCQKFISGQIVVKDSVTILKIITFITNFFGISNVIFASLDNKDIVIKKLAQTGEFNNATYSFSTFSENGIHSLMLDYLNVSFGSNTMRNIRLCPTVDKFDLLYKILTVSNEVSFDNNNLLNLWFTLNMNPEPLIQKILPPENGWPIPRYIGSCGKTVVSEYCGEMLTDHVQDSWDVRAGIAHQLLIAAMNFTFSHPVFSFYLTDVTPDNIALSLEGKVTFIDLDNIIIVEKNTTAEFLTSWNQIHSCEETECDNCFAFSSDDICSHKVSDHNIYAVCKEILSPKSYLVDGGLLHSPPESFLKRNPQFWTVLLHCIQPPHTDNRFQYAKQLIRILK